jgi:hypothetical protein
MSDGDGVPTDGVRDLVLGDVENRGGDGVKAARVPLVITPEAREMLNRRPMVIPPEIREKFTRRQIEITPEFKETFSGHWFQKGLEGGSPPIATSFQQYGLGTLFNVALDRFNRGSASRASNSKSTSSPAVTD